MTAPGWLKKTTVQKRSSFTPRQFVKIPEVSSPFQYHPEVIFLLTNSLAKKCDLRPRRAGVAQPKAKIRTFLDLRSAVSHRALQTEWDVR